MLKSRFGFAFDGVVRRALPFLLHRRVYGRHARAHAFHHAGDFAAGELRRGAAIAALGGLFDLADGVVARAQGRATRFGALLDATLDRLADIALLFGLALHYASTGEALWAWTAGVALAGSVLTSYAKARAEMWLRDFRGGVLERAERMLLLIAGGLFGLMPLALAVVAVGSVATAAQRIIIAWRRLGAEAEDSQP